ncbi:hypothetical protein Tco_1447534 [Tanacetum coccineum]
MLVVTDSPKGLIVACKLKSASAENDNHVKSGDAKPDSMELETEKESEPKADAKANSESLMKLKKIIRRIIHRLEKNVQAASSTSMDDAIDTE